jgi:hypothetical protein
MKIITKFIFKLEFFKVMESSTSTQLETDTKETLSRTNFLVTENTFGKMEIDTKETLLET